MMLFTIIAVAVDSSEKTDDFVKTGLPTSKIITEYYFGFVPFIWGMLFPLFVFIGVIYFTSRLASRSEIIAILASGTSFNRFLRAYLAGGVFLASILWVANRYYIPKANGIRSDFETHYLKSGEPGTSFSSKFYMRSDSNTYIGIKYYDTVSKRASSFFLDRVHKNKMIYNLRADVLYWDTAKKNNSWMLTNATIRTIDSMKETITTAASMKINLNIKPEDLRRDEYLKDKLTTPELSAYIHAEELRGTEGLNTLKVEKFRRTATPFTVILLTIIGAVIASRKTRGGSGLHLAIGIAIAAIFIISDRFSTVFSVKSNLPPLLAAWLPNIAFSFVAYYFYRKAPK
ncbi:MAG: LptF/LptG family permease [Chitinophagaceae bacterium]|nr:LptF/LptG family permease [Chitinophagaceae bacterium]